MSYYSMVCIEVVKDVWPRIHSQLKRRDMEFRHPDRVFDGKDTMLMVWEWNHAPSAFELEDEMYSNLGLDYRDFNITVVGEDNGYENEFTEDKHIIENFTCAGCLPSSYMCVDEKGHWQVGMCDGIPSTIRFEGQEIRPSYRLTDEEFDEMLKKKSDTYGDESRLDN